MHFSRRCSVLSLCGSRCGINVLCQQLEHKLVCFMRWPQDVWLWRLISSSLTAPVLILSPHTPLSTPPTPPSSLSPVSLPRRLTACSCGIRSFCSQAIVCVPHYVCVLPASHTEIMCISSYSQANPPPIIVNADSLDAGPYVSICSRCLLQYISLSFTLPVSVHEHVCMFASVCGWKGLLLAATCCLPCGPTSIFLLTLPVCWDCAFCSCACILTAFAF